MRNTCLYLAVIFTILKYSYSRRPFRDRPPLLAMTENGISFFDRGTWRERVLCNKSHTYNHFKSIDIHYKKKMAFWTESVMLKSGIYSHEIRSAKLLNGGFSEIRTVSTGDWTARLAVDWINDKLYFSDLIGELFTGDIYATNLDGTDKQHLLHVNMLHGDNQFQIDPVNRWIYFVSLSAKSPLHSYDILERVHMDMNGTNRQIIDADTCLDKNQYNCELAFAVDHTTGRVFWMDFFSSMVHSMDANGENRQTYSFSKYERAIRSNKYKMHHTIDKWIEIAYKGNLYGMKKLRKDKKNKIFRLNTRNNKIISLPLGVPVQHFRIFHSSTQPNNNMK
ncbi:low-density lipoprotein receptor-related protein 2-like [Mytilus trossulus]|uniref:low-density lipoprotein receptor-related protein 2-like n=1 Tax=Mytilus trossulus TaxID=6551 RepID=UPI003006AADE